MPVISMGDLFMGRIKPVTAISYASCVCRSRLEYLGIGSGQSRGAGVGWGAGLTAYPWPCPLLQDASPSPLPLHVPSQQPFLSPFQSLNAVYPPLHTLPGFPLH